MSAKPSEFKEKLNKAIKEAIERFRKDDSMPQGAFSRERVFSLKVLTKTILAMGGGDIAQELENLNIEASKAAFSQQRKKLSWTLFEDIFETFNRLCNDAQTYKGYRVFAVEGTAVNVATDPATAARRRGRGNVFYADMVYIPGKDACYCCTGEYETLATSLPRSITAEEIKELYHLRWHEETAFRELKYAVGLERIHGRSDEFAYQEIFAALIMANFCSRIALSAIIENSMGNKFLYAVNGKCQSCYAENIFQI